MLAYAQLERGLRTALKRLRGRGKVVVNGFAAGKINREIGNELGVSRETVRKCLHHELDRLRVELEQYR